MQLNINPSSKKKDKFTVADLFEESFRMTKREFEKMKGRKLTEEELKNVDRISRANVRVVLSDMKLI